MILANLVKAFREQNYYAVVLEFLIVIAGVVIGFQITAWNQVRSDRALEQEYLQRLSSDLQGSLELMQDDIDLLNGWRANAEFTYEVLRQGELLDDDRAAFDRGLIVGHWLNYTRGRYATIDELVTTGRLTLITDPDLRTSISQLRSDIENIQRMIELISDRQNAVMGLIQTRIVMQDMMEFQVHYDFEALVEDDAFINAYGNSTSYLSTNVFWLEQISESTRALKHKVDCSLGVAQNCEP